jgi:hypothetical protein
MVTQRKRREKRQYFTKETDDAIILYNQETDHIVKGKIYEKYIHYPIFKLTQNLIHTFKFYNTDVEDLEHLQHELEVFLLSKMHLFHHSNSIQKRITKIITKNHKQKYTSDFNKFTNNSPQVTQTQINDFINTLDVNDECLNDLKKITPPKAYSYFGTIAKRWLIIYSNKNYNKKINNTPLEELETNETYSYTLESKDNKLSNFIDEYVHHVSKNIYNIFPKNNHAQIADAILEEFRKKDSLDLDIFNKKLLYVYVREQIDVKTPKITKIINILKKIFISNYTFYLENDFTEFKTQSI